MATIKNLVESDEIENYDLDDRFILVMEAFHKKMSGKMKKFNMTVQNVTVSTKRVMRKFAFGTEDNPQTIESFFKIWFKFFEDFRGAKEKLILLEKERQKRIAKRKKMKEKEKKLKMHKKYGSKQPLPSAHDDAPELSKGSSLYREFEKRQKFEAQKGALHGKLMGHVKKKSIFVQNGGRLDGQTQNDTMRRLSSMYQDDMNQVKALQEARKKAAILKYNKFKLPAVTNSNKWTNNRRFTDQSTFVVPDDKPMLAPRTRPSRNAPNKQHKQLPPNKQSKGSPKVKVNGHGTVPPPPNSVPPANAPPMNRVGGSLGFQPMNNYGANPAAAWQQQQALGYGSNPNLTYNQAMQSTVGNAAHPMYGQQQQGQYRPNQMQPMGTKYNTPYKYGNNNQQQ